MFAQQESKIGDFIFFEYVSLRGVFRKTGYKLSFVFRKKKIAETGICLLFVSRRMHQNITSEISKFMLSESYL